MVLKYIFRKLTDNATSTASSGKHEELFFDIFYRYMYIFGFSQFEKQYTYLVYRTVVLFMMLSILTVEFFYLYHEPLTLDVLIDNFSVTVIHVMCLYRYGSMLYNMKYFMQLTRAMESETFDLATPRRQRLMESWIRKNKTYFTVLLIGGFGALATWSVYPLVDDVKYNFLTSVRLPFDHRTPTRYFYTYPCVLLAYHYISLFVIGTDLMIQAVMVHMCCQFSILAECFRSVLMEAQKSAKEMTSSRSITDHVRRDDDRFEDTCRDVYTATLRKHIRQHQLLLDNAAQLKALLSSPMLAQVAASSLIICFVGYEVTASVSVNRAKFVMMIQYLTYALLQLMIFCGWSNEIDVQSGSISEAIYSSGWERGAGGAGGEGAALQLAMLRARKPLVMTAGGVYDMSLPSYMALVKTSYSALTVLLRLRKP